MRISRPTVPVMDTNPKSPGSGIAGLLELDPDTLVDEFPGQPLRPLFAANLPVDSIQCGCQLGDMLGAIPIRFSVAHGVLFRSGPDGPASPTTQPGGIAAYSASVTATRRCPIRAARFHNHHSVSPPTPRSSVTAARSSRPGDASFEPSGVQRLIETCQTGRP